MTNPINAFVKNSTGTASLLNNLIKPKKPGQFTPKTTAVINIQTTLDSAKTDATKQLIVRGALNRLEGIRRGLIQPDPKQEWETTAGFLMLTGQPFRLLVDAKGQISTESQTEGKLDGYTDAQKAVIKKAAADFKVIGDAVDLAKKKTDFRNKLHNAVVKLVQLEQHFPKQAQWEKDFYLYKEIGQPVKVALDSEGNVIALNQLTHDFSDVTKEADRLKLLAARDRLKNILNKTATANKTWEYQALGASVSDDDFFLDLDNTGNIVIRKNINLDNVTKKYTAEPLYPDFLKPSAADTPKTTAKWQDDAVALYQQNKPFHFDFDPTGQNIVVRENNFINVMGLHKPKDRSDLILQARLNMLA